MNCPDCKTDKDVEKIGEKMIIDGWIRPNYKELVRYEKAAKTWSGRDIPMLLRIPSIIESATQFRDKRSRERIKIRITIEELEWKEGWGIWAKKS